MKINTIKETTKEINFSPDDVICAYIGKPHACMCGCSGDYYYTSMNAERGGKERGYKVEPDEINDDKVNKILKVFEAGGRIENLDDYIFTLIRNERQYTIYLAR